MFVAAAAMRKAYIHNVRTAAQHDDPPYTGFTYMANQPSEKEATLDQSNPYAVAGVAPARWQPRHRQAAVPARGNANCFK